jgi:hypothetical protein
MTPPQIPIRTSSKRTCSEIEKERDEIQDEVKKMRRELKPQASFSSSYFRIPSYF